MSEPIDLGRICLCVNVADVDRTAAFYQRIGFRPTGVDAPKLRKTLVQGRTILTFMSFLDSLLINYRGASIHAVATELAGRGFEIVGHNRPHPELQLMLDENGEPLPDNECGDFTVIDPDGNPIFFNTHPPERAPHEARNWLSDPAMAADVTIPLGQLVLCFDVKDLATSLRFYQELGLSDLARTADSATMDSLHPQVRDDANGFPIRLRQAPAADQRLAFRCEDVDAVAASLRALGIEVLETLDGPAFVDPDDRRVSLMARSGSIG
jgi:catechol 2,3-dioxygenase-like lactoylglutathione lyase family enzyme